MKAWIYQDDKQVKKVGASKASWYVGWLDPEGKRRGKSCGPGPQGKRLAEKEAEKISAALISGTYQDNSKKTWKEFRQEYQEKITTRLSHRTRQVTLEVLAHFERVARPGKVATIKTQTVDDFVARRRLERGKQPGSTVSPATVNKELRHLKAALRVAWEWHYLPEMPHVRMLKEARKLATFVSPEHFAAIYQACEQARLPNDLPGVAAADWWRALIVFASMTGWRISELLALRRDDLHLEKGVAITRAEDNKGKRDEEVKLHLVVIEHLRLLASFDSHVFPWNHNRRTLDDEFHRIQLAAGIGRQVREQGRPARFEGIYGFHDLRRAFATQNAPRLTADALQKLMRHKSYLTTQRYINLASQLDEAVDKLHVPDVLRKKEGA
jgi:integrase